jgi:hypothetical protein
MTGLKKAGAVVTSNWTDLSPVLAAGARRARKDNKTATAMILRDTWLVLLGRLTGSWPAAPEICLRFGFGNSWAQGDQDYKCLKIKDDLKSGPVGVLFLDPLRMMSVPKMEREGEDSRCVP